MARMMVRNGAGTFGLALPTLSSSTKLLLVAEPLLQTRTARPRLSSALSLVSPSSSGLSTQCKLEHQLFHDVELIMFPQHLGSFRGWQSCQR